MLNETKGPGLYDESSPYLRQHADNPVHWFPWTEDAFATALARDVPILLSIGYAACHWCHVMAHESFENKAIADQMNADFVCIKVDREERPDIDAVYMRATQMLNEGHGGWPMTVFLMPDGRPFFAGTYYAPQNSQGRLGFPDLMTRISQLWRERRDAVTGDAERLTHYLSQSDLSLSSHGRAAPTVSQLRQQASATLSERFDPTYGGFGHAPKFPPVAQLRFLLDQVEHEDDATARMMATSTLDAMVQGGFYDLVGGGFSRYATDEQWRIPHFEKMLYDNALLASVYCRAALVLRAPRFLEIAQQTVKFVLREMRSSEGGFIASLDADTEGEEGRYYTYSYKELSEALGETQLIQAASALNCSEVGNWENGRNIISKSARSMSEDTLSAIYKTLFDVRKEREAPGRDDKVIVGHNGLMISALVQVGAALDSPELLATAQEVANFCWKRASLGSGRLARLASSSPRVLDGVLEDYAYFAAALTELYSVVPDDEIQKRAASLLERVACHFVDRETGGLVMTADDQERLLFRPAEAHDGATPSAQAIAITAWHALGEKHLSSGTAATFRRAENALLAAAGPSPSAYCQALIATRQSKQLGS